MMFSLAAKQRAKVQSLLPEGEPLVGLTPVGAGVSVGQVGGRDMTLHSVSDYLRENGLTAIGVPSDIPGKGAHAFMNGWLVATDRRIAFVVPGFLPMPKTIVYSVPFERVTVRWGDATSLGNRSRLYHLTYEHTNGKVLDLVRRGPADADADAFLDALGDCASPL